MCFQISSLSPFLSFNNSTTDISPAVAPDTSITHNNNKYTWKDAFLQYKSTANTGYKLADKND